MFANSFVSLLVGGYVCYWVCLFDGLWPCHNIMFFISRDRVSVELFHYRFKAIPWILNYKWADYWPYCEFIYLVFFYVAFCCYVYYHGVFVSCLGVWVLGFLFLFCDKYLY